MTLPLPAGFPTSRKTPGVSLAVVLGGTATSAGNVPLKLLLIGNKIASALTGAAPSFSVAAGTQANATPVQIYSPDDALTYFGQGSELHRMALGAFAQYPDALIYAVSNAESGGAAATAVLTFATSASAAYSVRFKFANNVVFDVPVASGDSVTTIATACATAILANPDLPFTAQYSAGVLTLTAKHPGPRGNLIIVDAYFVSAAGLETRITGSSTASGAGTTASWTTIGSAIGSELPMQGGTTADSLTAVITAINAETYDRIAVAQVDTTNVDALMTAVNAQALITSQIRQQVVCASVDTAANATTFATGRNQSRLQVAWHYGSRVSPGEVAAVVAAARLAGDAAVNDVNPIPGEASDPAANLNGLQLAWIPVQPFVSMRPTPTQIETGLNNGFAALVPSSRSAYTALVSSITSRSLAAGVQNYAVYFTGYVTVCDYVANDLQSFLASTYAGYKLGTDSSDGTPPRAPRVVTPSLMKAAIYNRLLGYEADAILRDVEANYALLAVQADAGTPGRVIVDIPAEVMPPVNQIVGTVRQTPSL